LISGLESGTVVKAAPASAAGRLSAFQRSVVNNSASSESFNCYDAHPQSSKAVVHTPPHGGIDYVSGVHQGHRTLDSG